MLPDTLNSKEVSQIIDLAISEDVGKGDITSELLIPQNTMFSGKIASREPMVCAGLPLLNIIFSKFNSKIKCNLLAIEGATILAGKDIAYVEGPAIDLLCAERTAINLLQHLSGIATLTRQFVERIAGTNAILLDTRKTVPGLRVLAKYATKIGGAQNHRMRLDDGILIKDNHIAVAGSISEAIKRAKVANLKKEIEIECETLSEVAEAVESGADKILLDNMDLITCKKAVLLIDGKVPTEASGDITLENIREVAETGVTYISVGRLTHSARAVNMGLDWNSQE